MDERKVEQIFDDIQGLKKIGEGKWIGLCPFHEDRNPSFGIKIFPNGKVRYTCFACGKKGSIYDYVMEKDKISFKEATEKVHSTSSTSLKPVPQNQNLPSLPKTKRGGKILSPVPKDAPPPPAFSGITDVYVYQNELGETLGYAYRIEDEKNKKKIIYLVYTDGGWDIRGFDKPYPIYGMQFAVKADVVKPVLVCEGEKTADAARALFGFPLCVSWPGGAQSWRYADWNQLSRFKNIIVCCDADEIGLKTGKDLCSFLHFDCGLNVRLFIPPAEWPKKADWADVKIPREKAIKILQENLAIADDRGNFKLRGFANDIREDISSCRYFSIIGQRIRNGKTELVFHRHGVGILYFSPESLTPKNLFQLAPSEFWREYDVNYSRPKNIVKLIDDMYKATEGKPILRDDSFRGIGVWKDNDNQIVVNDGGRVTGKNFTKRGTCVHQDKVYECTASVPFYSNIDQVLTDENIKEIGFVLESATCEQPWGARLMAGWAFCAPICGVLDWRPHLWITGRPGSGKSFLVNFFSKLLDGCAVSFQGNTTEAGVRQSLGCAARPFIIDEFDPKGEKGLLEQQNIIAYARACSTGDSPPIIKGGASGFATAYTANSMMLASSIVTRLEEKSDQDRFTVVELKKRHEKTDQDPKILAIVHNKIYNKKWFATVLDKYSKFVDNEKKTKKMLAQMGKDQRFCDQYGTLIAGWATLTDTLVTDTIVEDFLKTVYAQRNEGNSQPNEIMSLLMSAMLKNSSTNLRTMIAQAHRAYENSDLMEKNSDYELYSSILKNHGIKYFPEKKILYISKSQWTIEALKGLNQPFNTLWTHLTYHEDYIKTVVTKIDPGSTNTRFLAFKYEYQESDFDFQIPNSRSLSDICKDDEEEFKPPF